MKKKPVKYPLWVKRVISSSKLSVKFVELFHKKKRENIGNPYIYQKGNISIHRDICNKHHSAPSWQGLCGASH